MLRIFPVRVRVDILFKKKLYKNQVAFLLFSGVVIALDQWTKHLALNQLLPYIPAYITSVFNLTLARNTGAAFSFLDSASGWQSLFFLCVNFCITVGLLVWLFMLPPKNRLKSFALSLIVGGAWGNIIDRVQLGYVVDFLDFHLGIYHWPIFNIADSAVCVGVVLLLFTYRTVGANNIRPSCQ